MMHFLGYLRIGIALTLVALLIGTAISIVIGSGWLLTASISLVVTGAIAFAFVFIPGASPNNARQSWTAFSDIRHEGHSTVGGGLGGGRSSIEPGSISWNTHEFANAVTPLLIAAMLVGVWLAL